MSAMDRIKGWFFDEDEYETEETVIEPINTKEEVEGVKETPKKTSIFENAKSTKTSDAIKTISANRDGHLVLVEPKAYKETQEIADYLKQKRATVVNLHRLNREQCKRVIDFLSGVIYAIDGDIQQIAPNTFLCTPKNIGVSGNISFDAYKND